MKRRTPAGRSASDGAGVLVTGITLQIETPTGRVAGGALAYALRPFNANPSARMHHRLSVPSADEPNAIAPLMSFGLADSLPTGSWSPPNMLLLYEASASESKSDALALPAPCEAWAATERLGL